MTTDSPATPAVEGRRGRSSLTRRILGIAAVWIGVLLLFVWCVPNSQQLVEGLKRHAVALRREHWRWMSLGGLAVVVFLLVAINGSHGSSEFIYFNF